MKNLKLRAKNKKHSEAIQLRAFELGYSWVVGGVTVWHTEKPYLFFCEDGNISHGTSKSFFNDHSGQEVTLDDLYDMSNDDTSNKDTFEQSFPQLAKCIEDLYTAFNDIKNNQNK